MNLHSLTGFPVFQTVLEANHILKRGEQGVSGLTKEEEKELLELAKDPNIGQRVYHHSITLLCKTDCFCF